MFDISLMSCLCASSILNSAIRPPSLGQRSMYMLLTEPPHFKEEGKWSIRKIAYTFVPSSVDLSQFFAMLP